MSTDPRPARTRAKLRDAALTLSLESGRLPSASELSRHSGVSRSLLYAHYDGVEGVMATVLDESLASLMAFGQIVRDDELVHGSAATRLLIDAVIELVSRERAFYGVMLARACPPLKMRFAETLGARLREGFDIDGAEVEVSAAVKDATAVAIANGMTGVLADWLDGSLDCSREELLLVLVALFPEWTHGLRTRRTNHPAVDEPGATKGRQNGKS